MARTTERALIAVLAASLLLAACGRRGPLEAPGTQNPPPAPTEQTDETAKPAP